MRRKARKARRAHVLALRVALSDEDIELIREICCLTAASILAWYLHSTNALTVEAGAESGILALVIGTYVVGCHLARRIKRHLKARKETRK